MDRSAGARGCVSLLLLTQQRATVWLFAAILLAVGAVLYVLARAATRRQRATAEN